MEGIFFLFFFGVLAFIAVVFVLVFMQWAKGMAEWADNNRQPVVTLPARAIAKRTEVNGWSSGRTWTSYYCTFELADGDRREFSVSGHEYGLLAEGDTGELTCQGTRYHGFRRRMEAETDSGR